MIKLSGPVTESREPDQALSEGMVNEVLKATSGTSAEEVKAKWEDIKEDDKGSKAARHIDVLNNDVVGGVGKNVDAIDKFVGGQRVDTRSIIAKARNSILQFPMYVTQTLRVNEAHIISQLFDRVYTSYVQAVLAQHPIIDENEANNLLFLKQFHTNLKESVQTLMNEYYEPIDDLDSMLKESVFNSEVISPNCTVEFSWVPTTNTDLISENARLLNEPLMGLPYLTEAKQDNRSVTKKISASIKILSEKDLEEIARDRAGLTERELKVLDQSAKDIESEVKITLHAASHTTKDEKGNPHIDPDIQKKIDDEVDRRMKVKKDAEDKLKKSLTSVKEDIKNKKMPGYSWDGSRYRLDSKDRVETTEGDKRAPDVISAVDTPKLLKDTDVKKVNSIQPYNLETTFRVRDKKGGLDRDVHFLLSIKSVMHLIRTQDIAEDLRELVTGNIKSLRKVRYKTGEISFMDYLFNIKGIKADAAKHVNYNKRWMNTLKRLGEFEKMNGSLLKTPIKAITGGDVPIPNATLILTQTDVTTLTNQTGIDLSIVSNAKRLAKTLFLISIVIVDSSAGSMRILFPDKDTDWDVHSLASIDAELSKTDNSQIMRELNRMVNR